MNCRTQARLSRTPMPTPTTLRCRQQLWHKHRPKYQSQRRAIVTHHPHRWRNSCLSHQSKRATTVNIVRSIQSYIKCNCCATQCGHVQIELDLSPRFDYSPITHWLRDHLHSYLSMTTTSIMIIGENWVLKVLEKEKFLSFESRFRSLDLWVMSPTRFRCANPKRVDRFLGQIIVLILLPFFQSRTFPTISTSFQVNFFITSSASRRSYYMKGYRHHIMSYNLYRLIGILLF